MVPAVKIGASRQVVIPKIIHKKLGLNPGDYLSVEMKEGQVIFTPQTLIDKRLAEGLADLKAGRVYGPFDSARRLISSLQHESKKLKTRPKAGR